jgi:hypothetical protein
MIGLMTDLAGVENPKSAQGWFTGIFDIFGVDNMVIIQVVLMRLLNFCS